MNENELYHFGIPGMKWYVRRFQNYDGSLTEEGRQRYSKEFSTAMAAVKHKISTTLNPIKDTPINEAGLVKRSGLTDEYELFMCKNIAQSAYKDAKEKEPAITKDVMSAVSKTGAKMYGLDNRLKTPTSLAGKIGADAKDTDVAKDLGYVPLVAFMQAAGKINDRIRYTTISSDNEFVKNYKTVKKDLRTKGYEEVKCKNYYEKYRKGEVKHKSVQSVFKSQDGTTFELQFHTLASQAAKDLKVPLYEEHRRRTTTAARRSVLEKQMLALAEQVEYPNGIRKILSYG